jgi:hypothetical protein
LHERSQSLVSYFCMSVDAAAGGCAHGARLRVGGAIAIAL